MKRYEGTLMKTRKARFALFLLLGFMLLLAGACGPGGGADDPAPSPAPAPAPVGPGAAAQIDLLVSRATITTDDVSTSTITAVVKDARGNLVKQGTKVDFAAQGPAGAYDAIAPRSAQTDEQGRASTVITALSSAAAGNYTVTASSGAVQAARAVRFTSSQVASVVLSTGGTTSIVANGTSTLRLDATAVNSAGTPMPEGTAVTFTTTQGFFADSLAPGGFAAITEVAISGSSGMASVLLYSSTNLGTANVTASVGTPPGDRNASVFVDFISGPAAQVFVSALPANLPADGVSTSNIRVTVLDAWGNPVADGASVVLSLAQGSGTLSTLSTQTVGGLATAIFTAPSSVPATNPVTITARAGNAPDATTNINLTGPQISGISLSANPPSLPADGASTAFVSATVSVTGGGTAPDGTEVVFSIVEGAGVITHNHTTAGGVATAVLTASAQEGTATIRAQAGGRQAEMEIEYKPGKVELTATPNTILATGKEESKIVAQVAQANGLPVTNTLIAFSLSNADMGSLSPTSALSDSTGKARTTFTAAKTGGTVVVTGTWTMQSGTQVRGSANIFVQSAPAIINVAQGYPLPTAVSVRGQGGETTSVIVFEVRDAQNQLVADGYRINFAIQTGPNGGESLVPDYAFTQSGKVSTTLRSGFKSGPVSIKATYHNDTQVTVTTSSLAIGNGPPVGEAFGLYSYYRNLSGLNPQSVDLETTVLATVADVVGNAVPDDTAIAFKTYNTGGLFPVPSSAPTQDGLARITYTAKAPPNPVGGFVSLTAEATDGGRTTRVMSISVDPFSLGDPMYMILYAATNGGGVYKSTDSGTSWKSVSRSSTEAGQNWIDPYVNAVAADPTYPGLVWAVTGYGGQGNLYRSFDGGQNWNSDNIREVFGLLELDAAVLAVLPDDASDYLWAGTNGEGVFVSQARSRTATSQSSGLTFTQATGLGLGRVVRDIVKVPGTSGATARLYAATATGLWTSTNGGLDWVRFADTFSGANIRTLAVYNPNPGGPAADDIIYAGTLESGVWIWDSANKWRPFRNGMGSGLRATKPVLAAGGVGTGTVSTVGVNYSTTQTQTWTLECVAENPAQFSVTGSVSGPLAANATEGVLFGDAVAGIDFTIIGGETPFALGDTFTFDTIRDPGGNIQDLLLDKANNKLYAATYFYGALEPHPVGAVYVLGLAAGGLPAGSPWSKASTGLPQYEPPDDKTLFAQHALALDNPANPTRIFVGGQGINLYRATDGIAGTNLANGTTVWQASKSGLTNLLMARRTVLMSGAVSITNLTQRARPSTPGSGSVTYDYEWFIEDSNGNPPIAGSELWIKYYRYSEEGEAELVEEFLYEGYGDVVRNRGTWRDKNDRSTRIPFRLSPTFGNGIDYGEIVFNAACEATAPGCAGASVIQGIPFLAGEVVLNADKLNVPVGGASSTTITARVTNVDGSEVADGSAVTFYADDGFPLVATALTANGEASFTLTTSNTAGTVDVIAIYEGARSNTLKINFTPDIVDSVSASADPATLSADGSSKSDIIARVRDQYGNIVADGTKVTFALEGPSGPVGTPFVDYTQDGEAGVRMTASQEPGAYTVTVTASSGGITRTTLVNLTLTPENIAILNLTNGAGQTNFSMVADGTSYVTLVAKVYNTAGIPVADGTQVNFAATAGYLVSPGGPRNYFTGTVNGEARVRLYSPPTIGNAVITAASGGVQNSVFVSFVPGEVAQITMSANPGSLLADGTTTSLITLLARDAQGNPVADGSTTLVYSLPSSDYGTLDIYSGVPVGGQTSFTYRSPSAVPGGSNQAVITARATNQVTGTVSINLTGPQIGAVALSADPSSLPADGVSQATIFAEVSLVAGGPAPDGQIVRFSIVGGGGTLSSNEVQTGGGFALTRLTSSDVHDFAIIRAEAGGRTDELKVSFKQGEIKVSVIPDFVLANQERNAQVRVEVKDANGQPVVGEEIYFSLSNTAMGEFSPYSVVTTEVSGVGYAETTLIPGTIGGTVKVRATWKVDPLDPDQDVTGEVDFIIATPPASIEMADLGEGKPNPNPASISVRGTGGRSTSILVFDVKDATNKLVADGYRINFTLETGPNGGESIIPLYAYTKGGQVSTTLRSGLKSGSVSIRATYHQDTDVTTAANQVAIDNGPPVGEEFGIFSTYNNISGWHISNLEDPIGVIIADIYGQAIPDNTAVSFKTYNTGGAFPVPSSAGTTNGVAMLPLRSGTVQPIEGFVSVTGEVNNGGRTTRVSSFSVVPREYLGPGADDIIYIGTNGGGPYLSTTGGADWKTIGRSSVLLSQNWISPYVNDIVVHPDNPSLVFAATGFAGAGAIYRSFNGGSTWNSDNTEEIFGAMRANPFVYDDGGGPVEYNRLSVGVSKILLDRYSDWAWVGSDGQGLHYTEDCTETPTPIKPGLRFRQTADTLAGGKVITDLKKWMDLANAGSTGTAVVYAGTLDGVYVSVTSGQGGWTQVGNYFAGSKVNTLELFPDRPGNRDVLYIGTQETGFWYTQGNQGAPGNTYNNWTNLNTGLGKGLRATTPFLNFYSKGNGVIEKVDVFKDTKTEDWELTFVEPGGYFKLVGSVSGPQALTATVGQVYEIPGVLRFTVKAGQVAFANGDKFTFSTVRDPGRNIVALLHDSVNQYLYAATEFFGPIEGHSVGNLYVLKLDAAGLPIPHAGDLAPRWIEANTGLPEFDPPTDTSLFAIRSLAFTYDDLGNPTAILAGCEGIHLYKATQGVGGTDLSTATLNWLPSDFALGNVIMGRRPVLFSGVCNLKMAKGTESYLGGSGLVQLAPASPSLINAGTETTADGFAYRFADVEFFWYVEDINGNPPIEESKMEMDVWEFDDQGNLVYARTETILNYPDSLVNVGTWRDRNDVSTNFPFYQRVRFQNVKGGIGKVVLRFVPGVHRDLITEQIVAPGSSGGTQEYAISGATYW